ncbi:thiol reductant ABC exporter subunit CydD [Shinella daejeonensis]|uniref:thiol reductant ABC exporter subunit CydD n=1 Tax=Shinella daejeonensis TaxID=659017 RepID=UPI0020C7683A|nr:thiol reductant ABC exporter subunit CydD [Shinella daejeonensis]
MNRKQPSDGERGSPDTYARLDAATGCSILAAVLWVPQAFLIADCLAALISAAGQPDLPVTALAVAGLGLLRALFDAAAVRLSFRRARPTLSMRREAALGGLSARPAVGPGRMASGEAASILAEQADLALPYLTRYRPARVKAVAVPLVMVLAVLFHSWVAAVILLVSAPLIPLFMALVGWQARAASERQLAATGSLNGFLLDRLRGMTTLRSLGAVDRTAGRLRQNAEDLRERTMRVLAIAFLSSAVLELFAAIGIAMVAVYVGFSLLGSIDLSAWGAPIDFRSGLFVLLLAPAFFEPLRDLSAVWHDKAAGQAALAALDRLAAPRPQTHFRAARPAPAVSETMEPAVRLSGVTFGYGDGPYVLEGFDLSVSHGQSIAFVGPSGSGKSTLLALIAGLLVPDAGEIRPAQDRQTRIGWIGPSPHVFTGTIRSNIRLGRNLPAEAVDAAIRTARLERAAAAYGPRLLAEGGRGLSGGEVMRLAIARAAADPACILLLADEPTAHLDDETARDIARSLTTLAKGRTLIVATHDMELAARMDRIIMLEPKILAEAAE